MNRNKILVPSMEMKETGRCSDYRIFRRIGLFLFLLSTHSKSLVFGSDDRSEPRLRQVVKQSGSTVQIIEKPTYVVINNNIVCINLTVPEGAITSLTYKGGRNLLQINGVKFNQRGHWDIVWSTPSGGDVIDDLVGTSYKLIMKSNDQIEVSFTSKWNSGSHKLPLNFDKRFVMLSGSSGFYSYAVLEKPAAAPSFSIPEFRMVFKLQQNMFSWMSVADDIQRTMPTAQDRLNGKKLAYPEAVLLNNPSNPTFKNQVDDKYFYSLENRENRVHGWATSDASVGCWVITPADEFRTGGPFKQDLTSHVGPTALSMFISRHYAGNGLAVNLAAGEYWKKVFGPVFIYLNSDSSRSLPNLWEDAKNTMQSEVANWPYTFPRSNDYVQPNQRGAVAGKLLIFDWAIHSLAVPASSAYVGLAQVGTAGSWQYENKGYQFWTKTGSDGSFVIKNVIPGTYSLFASVPGFLGDYKYDSNVVVSSGSSVSVGSITFNVPRKGHTIWEIGVPDRSAKEFFIPTPSPPYKANQYNNDDRYREYGLWERYSALYPNSDLVFKIGTSDYRNDWFFAQVNRIMPDATAVATTWQIVFYLSTPNPKATYTLQLALASANLARLQVRVNNPNSPPLLSTGLTGRDNSVARHGIHGLHYIYSIGIPGYSLVDGENTVLLTQANAQTLFEEVMYDYIRLEGPQ